MEEALIKKTPPHSLEAEQAVIGSILMDMEQMVAVSDILASEDFYSHQNGTIYGAMVELYEEKKKVDLITLQNKLKEKDVPESVYSLEYMRSFFDKVQTSVNAEDYAKIVKEKATLRRIIKTTENITNECYLGKNEVPVILESIERDVFALLQNRMGAQDFVPIKDIVLQSLDEIAEAAKNKGMVTGVPTGFIDLDNKLSGMHPAELILVAARPAMGKTAFVLNIAQHVALREHITTAIFSLEMPAPQLVKRMMSLESMVEAQAIRTGELKDDEWEKLAQGAGAIGMSKHLIVDDTTQTLAEIRSKCRAYKQQYGLGLVIIDYLQLIETSSSRKNDSRQQQISEISRALKLLSREIDAPIIALSQLSRAVDARPDHKPVLSDLRESGAIEQDADVVMFIYRDDYYNPDSEKKNIAEIIVAKQRNGSTGSVELVWLGQYTKFANKEK